MSNAETMGMLEKRYIEAAICGILVGNMYAPNGNPWPGPKFDYKLAWLEALDAHARNLLDSGAPALLMGDFNVIPTEQDVYKPERWKKDALFAPEARVEARPGGAFEVHFNPYAQPGMKGADDMRVLGVQMAKLTNSRGGCLGRGQPVLRPRPWAGCQDKAYLAPLSLWLTC